MNWLKRNWLVLMLLVVAAAAKAVMDCAQIGALNWGDFWNEPVAWAFKYANHDPKAGPAFLLSTTALVFITSGWHLAQFVFLSAIMGAVVFYERCYLAASKDAAARVSFMPGAAVSLYIVGNRFIDFAVFSVGFKIVFQIIYGLLKGSL